MVTLFPVVLVCLASSGIHAGLDTALKANVNVNVGILPPVNVSADGRFADIAQGVSPIPIGLYAMVFASYPPPPPGIKKKSQFPPMTSSDWDSLVKNEYIAAVSLHFTWADVQPLPPPAPLNFSVLTESLDAIDLACVSNGKPKACLPVFLKPYLVNEPLWTYTGPTHGVPTVATNNLGMRVVVRPTFPNGTDMWDAFNWAGGATANRAIPISTDPVWRAKVLQLGRGIGDWLATVDPDTKRVRVMHFLAPAMTSIQMRPGPQQLFEFLDNYGSDTLGMNWSKATHIAAWQDNARAMASASPEFAKRAWAFDFTVLPESPINASQLFLNTNDQLDVFNVLAASHPQGPGAVIAKTESLHVDLGKGCTTCAFQPDPDHSHSAFPYQLAESDNIPYSFIANRKGRHGWENFAALAMPALPFNHSKIPSMYPIDLLANYSMFLDVNSTEPMQEQQATLWAEVWRFEATNLSYAPACVAPNVLRSQLKAWDSSLRRDFKARVNGSAR